MMSHLVNLAENQATLAKQVMAMTNNVTMGWTTPLVTMTEAFSDLYVDAVRRFEQNLNTLNMHNSNNESTEGEAK